MSAKESAIFDKELLVVSALAALVIRQGKQSMAGRLICGIDAISGQSLGLKNVDREAMALVSRICLSKGYPDHGSEIHHLLSMCCKPLGDWLLFDDLRALGLSHVCLIDPEDKIPTIEAWDLANGFSSIGASIEEHLFEKLMELLGKLPISEGDFSYSTIREFVVRHPIATEADLHELGHEINASVWACVRQFYEQVPASWAYQGRVKVCKSCGNAVKQKGNGFLSCRTTACNRSNQTTSVVEITVDGLLRVTRAIHQYWVEPGIDEIRLYDALVAAKIDVQLYPHRDRVDIAFNDIGIDLKSYASPELLGARIKKSPGGLSYYRRKLLVIPDWLVDMTPDYIGRVTDAMEEIAGTVECMNASKAYEVVFHA